MVKMLRDGHDSKKSLRDYFSNFKIICGNNSKILEEVRGK